MRKPCQCNLCIGITKITCQGCSKIVEVPIRKVKYRGQKYCSQSCAQKNIPRIKKIIVLPLCACGCGELCKGIKSTYKPGHNPPKNHRGAKGKSNPNWRGGKPRRPHHTVEHAQFRDAVFRRDNYTCQKCYLKNNNLRAHHIIPVSVDVSKIADIDNGITLCHDCHWDVHRELKLWAR